MVEPSPHRTSAPVTATGTQVVDASPAPTLLLSPELQISVANAALARLLGYDLQAALDGPADRLVVTDERDALREMLRGSHDPAVAAPTHAVTMLRADEATIRTRWRVAAVGHAGELLVVIEVETEERRARPDLRRPDDVPADFLLQVFDAIPDPAVLYFELDKTVLDVNRAWASATGYDRVEVAGARLDQLDIWHDPAERARLHARLARDRRVREVAIRYHRRGDDAEREAVVSAAFVRRQGRDVVLAVARDVTGEREVEERARHAQRLEALGRLASSVAHDYNNVLSVVGGCGQELRRHLGEEDPRSAEVDEILRAVRHAADLTRQLLAFGRKSVQVSRVLDLNDLVGDLRPLLTRLIGPAVRLRIVRAPAPARVLADATAIRQVLMNLAANARDAMPGGGRLVVALSHVRVDARPPGEQEGAGIPPGEYVRLAVRDSGVGMDERTLARLFEPYFTTKLTDRGTGLGLSTVYGIVTQAGGYIDVDTAPAEGTTMLIHLPAVSDPSGTLPAAWR